MAPFTEVDWLLLTPDAPPESAEPLGVDEETSRMRKTLTAVALVMMAAAGTPVWWPAGADAQRGTRVGQPAPEIAGGPWVNSEPLSLLKLRDRVVLVEFWTYG